MRISFLAAMLACMPLSAQNFEQHFSDSTLRIDYVFSGTNRTQHIALEGMSKTANWYGRRHNLGRLQLEGNGMLTVLDAASGDTLYRHSFSTLFQEWQETEEATRLERAFQSTFLIPMPKCAVDVVCTLVDVHRTPQSELRHRIDPSDILIRDRSGEKKAPWRYLLQSGDPRQCIDVCFVAEGFTKAEMPRFLEVCDSSIMALAAHEPFSSMLHNFNFIAVMPPSQESGVSIPHDGKWFKTPLSSHYDTFYMDRYLTTPDVRGLYDLVTGIPCEHFIILANTPQYGGGGIYNSYTLASALCPSHRYEVIVHEFGHSFGGLADEYAYDDMYESFYPADTEPWEQNITTLHNFASKWKDMLPADTPIPTKPDGRNLTTQLGVYEGAGYQSRGVYRPVQECRMRVNTVPEFCPVCQRAIRRLIDFYTIDDQFSEFKRKSKERERSER